MLLRTSSGIVGSCSAMTNWNWLPAAAEVETINRKALTTISGNIGWLVKEETGKVPSARDD